MSNLTRFVGSAVIALILVSIPVLLFASFVFGWHGLLKTLLLVATVAEGVLISSFIYDRSEDE